jgi:hypothetical protein
MRRLLILASACAAFAAAANAKPAANLAPPAYTRFDGVYRSSGQILYLSEHRAKLAGLAGTLELQFAGIVPASSDADVGGARAYRITNAKEFFERNKSTIERHVWLPGRPPLERGAAPYCDELASFMTVSGIGPFPAEFHAPARSIYVAFFDTDRFEDIAPKYMCSADSYVKHEQTGN